MWFLKLEGHQKKTTFLLFGGGVFQDKPRSRNHDLRELWEMDPLSFGFHIKASKGQPRIGRCLLSRAQSESIGSGFRGFCSSPKRTQIVTCPDHLWNTWSHPLGRNGLHLLSACRGLACPRERPTLALSLFLPAKQGEVDAAAASAQPVDGERRRNETMVDPITQLFKANRPDLTFGFFKLMLVHM